MLAAAEHVRFEYRFIEFLHGLEGPLNDYFVLIFLLLAYGLITWGTLWLLRSRARRNLGADTSDEPQVGVGLWFSGGRSPGHRQDGRD